MRVAWIAIVLLMLTIMPHHHHRGGAICWMHEVCQHDGNINDTHTHHVQNEGSHFCFFYAKNAKAISGDTSVVKCDEQHTLLWTYALIVAALLFLMRLFVSCKIASEQCLKHVCLCDKLINRRGPPCMKGPITSFIADLH